jgi:hypothetical protein
MPCLAGCPSVTFILLAWSPLGHAADVCAQPSDRAQAECLADKMVGAAEGGSNLWVTNFMARCAPDEIRKRIALSRHAPS